MENTNMTSPHVDPLDSTQPVKKTWYQRLAQKFANMSKQTKLTLAIGTPVLAGLVTTTTLACVFAAQRGGTDLNEIKTLNINLKSPIKNVGDKLTADDIEVEAINRNDTSFIIEPGSSGYSIEPELGYIFKESETGSKIPVTVSYKGIVQKTSIYVQQGVVPTSTTTVHFELNGGTYISGNLDVQVETGTKFSTITPPEFSAKASSGGQYYKFGGWQLNGLPIREDYVITTATTVTASWTPVAQVTHQLIFDLSGDAEVKDGKTNIVSVEKGTKWSDVVKPIITRDGYSITGYTWEDKDGKVTSLSDDFVFDATEGRNYTIKISWIANPTPSKEWTVTFAPEEHIGAGASTVTVEDHSMLSKLNRPVMKPYVDEGTGKTMLPTGTWMVDEEEKDPEYEFVDDTTLVAKYEEKTDTDYKYTVQFDAGEYGHFKTDETGQANPYVRTYTTATQPAEGEMTFAHFQDLMVQASTKCPEVEGNIPQGKTEPEYVFNGWSIKDSWEIYEGKTIAVAQWKKNESYSKDYSVVFHTQDGVSGAQWSGSRAMVLHDDQTKFGDISKPTVTIPGSDKLFVGWVDEDGDPIDDDLIINDDVVTENVFNVYAKFVSSSEQATINFVSSEHVTKFTKTITGTYAGKTWKQLKEVKNLIPTYTTDQYWTDIGWYLTQETSSGTVYTKITDSYIIPNSTITITARAETQFITDTWGEIDSLSNGGTSGDGAAMLANHYGYDNAEDMVGLTKTVRINGQQHTVRLIGVNHDARDTNYKAALTFEFVNPICDSNGKSLAAFWMYNRSSTPTNYRYIDSHIRNNVWMNSEPHWYTHKSQNPSETYKTSVLEMIKSNDTGDATLGSILERDTHKITRKCLNSSGSSVDSHDGLFLPTAYELGWGNGTKDEGTGIIYSYYTKPAHTTPSSYVKRQINNSYVDNQKYRAYIDYQKPEWTERWSVAGGNIDKTANGVQYWLGSFQNYSSKTPDHVFWDGQFNVGPDHTVNMHALPVAPCFCIGITYVK